jgi:hypothetical protein
MWSFREPAAQTNRTRLAGSVRVEQDFGDIGDVLGSQFFETFDLRL